MQRAIVYQCTDNNINCLRPSTSTTLDPIWPPKPHIVSFNFNQGVGMKSWIVLNTSVDRAQISQPLTWSLSWQWVKKLLDNKIMVSKADAM